MSCLQLILCSNQDTLPVKWNAKRPHIQQGTCDRGATLIYRYHLAAVCSTISWFRSTDRVRPHTGSVNGEPTGQPNADASSEVHFSQALQSPFSRPSSPVRIYHRLSGEAFFCLLFSIIVFPVSCTHHNSQIRKCQIAFYP